MSGCPSKSLSCCRWPIVAALILFGLSARGQWTLADPDPGIVAYTNFLGQGLSFVDFNLDGWDDLTLTNASGSLEFHAGGPQGFTPVDLGITAGAGRPLSVMWLDVDNDGVDNWNDVGENGEDLSRDHDNDGMDDGVDPDDDNDNILDVDEADGDFGNYRYDHDNDGIWDLSDTDDDNDGLSDWFEINDGNDLTGQFDSDNDGIENQLDDDDDNDGILDSLEN